MTRIQFGLFALVLGLSFTSTGQAQEPIRFARMPDISPDGKLIAFSYLGDIWVVEAIGGVARRVTVHEAHDTAPVFSPDGRYLAFSSNRYGSYDVFIVPVHGGKPRRLTFDSNNDVVSAWSPDSTKILFSSRREGSFPPVGDLFTIPVQGGRERRISSFEGRDAVYSPKGDQIAYVRGPGTWYRKGYRGSANDDIWISQADGSQNRRLTVSDTQEGTPMWSPDGQTIYFVSEQFGVANICRMPVGGGTPTPVTAHLEESVRRARISSGGEWIVYECGPDLWVCAATGEPRCRKVAIEAAADDKTNPEQMLTFDSQGVSEYALAPNEQHAVLVIHGELFLISLNGGKAKRLTEHQGNDHDVAWSPDHKKLLFISDRGGNEDLYVLEHNDPDHPELVKAHQFKTTQLTRGTTPVSGTSFSPDGKLIAFLKDGKLWTMNPDGTSPKAVVEQLRVIEYDWTPDSKWLVFGLLDSQFASELYIIPAAGGKPLNITRYATRNFGLSFSSDGKKLAFISQRRQDLDVFVMSMQKPPREGETAQNADIDLEGIHLRVERATAMSSDESEVALKPDGSMVAFRSNALGGDDLWMATTNGSQVTRLTSGNQQPRGIRWMKNGNILFLDGRGALRFVRTALIGATGVSDGRVSFNAKMKIDRQDEFVQMFDESWRKLQHRFYDPKLHGADWQAIRARYRPLVQHVTMHEDFYDLVSLMLGELNASHLGISGRGRTPDEQTADLGLLWDHTYPGPSLRIREILPGGPADRRGLNLKAGDYVTAIDGTELTDGINLSELLNDKVGETVTLTVTPDPMDPAKRRKVEVRAERRDRIGDLMYRRWVDQNARRVEELTKGRLGYIHIKAMDMPSLDEFVRTLYSDNFDKDAIILDVRYNGGGFTHDKVLAYLGGKEHTFFITREGAKGTVMRENDRRWAKPVILLCNNRSYSDAEIFPHAFRSLGLGKLVGMPTGGYVIGTTNETLIDGSQFRVPRTGVFTASGVNMEKVGVTPDVIVDLHPDEVAKNQDAQLDKAVEVLLKDVETWKKAPKPDVLAAPSGEAGKTPTTGPGSMK
jgi:tricorn protease